MSKELLKLMKESVGEMDSKLGYSSKMIEKFFKEKYPLDYNRLIGLQPDEFTDDDILSRLGEILAEYNGYKSDVTQMQHLRFNSKELSFLFQYFRRPIKNEKGKGFYETFWSFYENLEKLKCDFSDDAEEQEQLADKVLVEMSPKDFFAFAYEIFEDWNHFPAESGSEISLFEELLLPGDYTKFDDWYEYWTYAELKDDTKSRYRGIFNKVQLRYLIKFYNSDKQNITCRIWRLLKGFLDYAYDPANEDSSIGVIESKNFLKFVERIKIIAPFRFAPLLEILAEIWEQSKAANDGFKLFEDFLNDYASDKE